MVGDLEMESSMQKGEGVRADDVGGRPKLTMRERFLGSKIRCRTSEVGEDDLQSSVSRFSYCIMRYMTVPGHAEGSEPCS